MLAQCSGAALAGLEAQPIRVEVDLAPGLPAFQLVGISDVSGREARERVRSALRNSGFRVPQTRVVVSLAPAELRKHGSSFDLAIALALLVATGQLDPARLQRLWALGELSLDGRLQPVDGVLAVVLAARRAAAKGLILPQANGAEARLIEGLSMHPADSLKTVVRALNQEAPWSSLPQAVQVRPAISSVDLVQVRGQHQARRSLELAACGGHHLLLVGPPGCGKTLLASALPALLPPLDDPQALLVSQIHALAGLHPAGSPLLRRPPFRAPHHSSTGAALVGGGSGPRPGELSLAHHGILFLDELAEFRRPVLDQLRQPLDSREILLGRAQQALRYPCDVLLVAATNPCPCGWWGDPQRTCSCGHHRRSQYWSRISGPMLDRFDLQVVLRSADIGSPQAPAPEPTMAVAKRVMQARQRMRRRNPAGLKNAHLSAAQLSQCLQWSVSAQHWWREFRPNPPLSGRSCQRTLAVARTLADLAGSSAVEAQHLAEALLMRPFDRPSDSSG